VTSKVGADRPKRPKTGGRQKGTPNKTTATLKDAILLAAGDVGEDGKGRDGLRGYLRGLAATEPKAFSSLLGRVVPMQVVGDGDGPLTVVVRKLGADA
jgi:hypothetical protein